MPHDVVNRELTAFALEQAVSASNVAIIGALLVGVVIWPSLGAAACVAWTSAAVIALLSRNRLLASCRRRTTREQDDRSARSAYRAMLGSSVVLGLTLASLPVLSFRHLDVESRYLLTTIFCCWAAGSMSSLGIMVVVHAAYSALLVGGVGLGWVLSGAHAHQFVIYTALVFYWMVLQLFARGFSKRVTEAIAIRVENASLVRRLSQANDAKNRFIMTASHDLRQPLHAIGLLGGVLMRARTQEDIDKAREALAAALSGMNQLFSAILDLSRLDSGSLRPAIQTLAAHDMVSRLDAEYRALCMDHGRGWECRSERAFIQSDPAMLERVLRNLLDNALKHGAPGSVGLALRTDGQTVTLSVVDFGPGIPTNERERIFEEFYRVNDSATTGLGLGLSIVQRLVRLLGAKLTIDCRDKASQTGTCFEITLPAADEASLTDYEEAEPPDVAGLRVLVLDDEENVLTASRAILEQWGCVVATCQDQSQAIAAARVLNPPHVALTDYRLGSRGNGLEALEPVRQAYPDMGLVIVTGESDADTLRRLRGYGFPVLEKPVVPEELRNTLGLFVGMD